ERERRGRAELAGLDREPEGLGADHRKHDAARRQQPHVGEVGERRRERQEHGQRQERTQERHRDEPEPSPRARAVEQRAADQLGRHGVDPGEQEHADERAASPDVEQRDREERPRPRSQRVIDRDLQLAHERAVGGRNGRTERPVPADDAHARGVGPGQEDGEEHEGPAAKRSGQQQRERDANEQLRERRERCEAPGDHGGAPELGVCGEAAIVVEADEDGTAVVERREVRETDPRLPADGIREDEEEKEGRRREEEVRGHHLAPALPSGAQIAFSLVLSKKCRRSGFTASRTPSWTLRRTDGSTRATRLFGPALTSSRISEPSGSTTSTTASKTYGA